MVEKLAMSTFGLMPVNSISNCEEEIAFGKLKRDSLILDLRDGWGGVIRII